MRLVPVKRYKYKPKKLSWRLQDLWFKLIRRFYVKDIDSNEDFYCWCGKPVLTRVLFCSRKCYNECGLSVMQDMIEEAKQLAQEERK